MNAETMLRDALATGAGALPVPEDPWPGFAQRERTHRRNRRIRVSAAVVAVVAAVGVQTSIVPLPGWAPGFAVAGRETALVNSPARGSLAGDGAFLAGLRREVKDVQDPGELWQVADRDKIKLVYGTDLPDRRLALVLVPLRFGFLTDQALIWYEGERGADPARMTEGGRVDGGETVVTYLDGAGDRAGTAVVVAPAGSTVSITTGFTYTAQGRVEHDNPVVPAPGDGIAEFSIPPAPGGPAVVATVTRAGRVLYHDGLDGGWSGTATEVAGPQLDGILRGKTVDRTSVQLWVDDALMNARLTAGGTTIGLPWTGTVDGQPAALLTLRQPGRGVLVYAFHGGASSFRQDLRLLLPAAGADRRPIAWRMRAEGKDDRTGLVNVVAPAGAARATMTVAGAAAVPIALDATGFGTTTLDPGAEASVTSYAQDGSVLGVTPVPPFETNSGGIPGDDPKTRIVP